MKTNATYTCPDCGKRHEYDPERPLECKSTRAPALVLQNNTEACFQAAVVRLAEANGWLVYHTYNSRRSNRGFPDLVLVRERVIFAELKVSRNKLTPEQEIFLGALSDAGAEVYVWRPEHWSAISDVLQGG